MKLIIGNKRYSSWSLRPWLGLKVAGIPFEEELHDIYDPGAAADRARWSPTGKVPVLVDDGLVLWDSLAIAEYLAEKYPDKQLWPADRAARATARSVVAEMHSGFTALRSACGMNIEAHLPETGALIWRDNAGVRADVQRLVAMWSALLQQHGGPMLFGAFSIADAFYAPVCMRLTTFALPVPQPIADYVRRVQALPGVKDWIDGALAEADFREFEEPYRLRR